MNRRIRKKRRVGEFNWKGFEVEATFDPPLQDVDKFLDDYLAFCDAHNLLTGGGMKDTSFGQFVTKCGRGRHIGGNRWRYPDAHCTEADRSLVVDYFAQFPQARVTVKPLKGAWP